MSTRKRGKRKTHTAPRGIRRALKLEKEKEKTAAQTTDVAPPGVPPPPPIPSPNPASSAPVQPTAPPLSSPHENSSNALGSAPLAEPERDERTPPAQLHVAHGSTAEAATAAAAAALTQEAYLEAFLNDALRGIAARTAPETVRRALLVWMRRLPGEDMGGR